ncbi:hypothetical protein RQP46_004455 [Phenoliferia psychrophenolica]
MQLRPDVRYVTGLSFGGHANQFLSTGKLLYLAKILNRVAIIPTLLPVHFDAGPANFSDFYDVPRFYHDTRIPAVVFSDVKATVLPGAPANEGLSCWSTHEVCVGMGNLQICPSHLLFSVDPSRAYFLPLQDAHGLWTDLWALHLRRQDFKEFTGLTPLEKYQSAVARVVKNIQLRLDNPDGWRSPGKENFRRFGIPANRYEVLT